ncbi:hypothetical protein DsansV1_C07g0069861 [Dioscorea sansibarensis]
MIRQAVHDLLDLSHFLYLEAAIPENKFDHLHLFIGLLFHPIQQKVEAVTERLHCRCS